MVVVKGNRSEFLEVSVVGLGVGIEHVKAYLETEKCKLSWVYDLDSFKAERFVEDIGQGRVAEHFGQIIEDENVDVVSIASYDDDHFTQVLDALSAEKHVFVEKPLCFTYEQLLEIGKAWRKFSGKIKLSSNLVLRTAPLYAYLKQIIESGELGDIYAIDGEYLYGRIKKLTEGWRKNVNDYSVMLGGGVHLIDLILWLVGQTPKTVYASGNRISTKRTDFKYNDYVSATLQFPSTLVANIVANFGIVQPHQHVLRVFGTHATFYYDDVGPRIFTTRELSIGSRSIELNPLPQSKGQRIPEFVNGILTDSDMNEHTQEIFDTISICVACDKSVSSGEKVEVMYV